MTFHSLHHLKSVIDDEIEVRWVNDSYRVVKDSLGQYLIVHTNGHAIGLTWLDGKTLNGRLEEFYCAPERSEMDGFR